MLPSAWSNDMNYCNPALSTKSPSPTRCFWPTPSPSCPLYQPGQTVRLVVYLRNQTPQGLRPLAPETLRLDVKDSYSRLVAHFEDKTNAYRAPWAAS